MDSQKHLSRFRQSEKKYRQLYQASRDALMILNINTGKFISGNKTTIKLFACKNIKEFTSYKPDQLSPKYQPNGELSSVLAQKMIKKTLQKGSMFFQWQHKKVNGKIFDATVLLNKLEIDNQILIQATVRDISQQKINENKIAQHQIEIEKLNQEIIIAKHIEQLKNRFISIASHELRTPLTAMRWSAEEMLINQNDPLTATQRVKIENIYNSSKKLAKLITDLLDLSKIEQDNITIKLQKYDIVKLLNKIVKELHTISKLKNIEIIINTPDQLTFYFDPNLMRQVYINLINNAIKYSKPNSKIFISIYHKNQQIISKITDQGIGIKKSDQHKIFEDFFRTEIAKQTKEEGTGLGLSVVKSILEKLNGRVWFESKLHKGSTFYVSIPETLKLPIKH